MSGADFLGEKALQAPGKDGDEGDLDEGDEVVLRPVEDRWAEAKLAAREPEQVNHLHPRTVAIRTVILKAAQAPA
jgi:hypothetical protein